MQWLNVRWIGLKLSPPLLLGLQEGRYEVGAQKAWKQIEKNPCFYPQEGKPSEEPWDFMDATRVMRDMHMDE